MNLEPAPLQPDAGAPLSPPQRRTALRLALVYWCCMFVADSVLGHFINIDPVAAALPRLVGFSASAVITWFMSLALLRLQLSSFTKKALLSFALTAVGTPLFGAVDLLTAVVCRYPDPIGFDPAYWGYTLIECASMLFGWNCLFIGLLYSFEVRDREQRLAAAREEALAVQMRALRYQVNPHFLFNTLNSIAGLIEEGAAGRAEGMVLSLSTFLRTTLALDPLHDVTLAEELALQQAYLAIERERFSDRLQLRLDTPPEVLDARVPSLILQPLIENAIKHGVSATVGPVEILLEARREADRLHIVVENDMPATAGAAGQSSGMGVGLRNVAERLRARFQGNSRFSSGELAPGRYRVLIDLPWAAA